MEILRAFYSQDGPSGSRNALGHVLFPSKVATRSTRSEAAGVVSPHLPFAANTLVDYGIAMWNKFPALREASDDPKSEPPFTRSRGSALEAMVGDLAQRMAEMSSMTKVMMERGPVAENSREANAQEIEGDIAVEVPELPQSDFSRAGYRPHRFQPPPPLDREATVGEFRLWRKSWNSYAQMSGLKTRPLIEQRTQLAGDISVTFRRVLEFEVLLDPEELTTVDETLDEIQNYIRKSRSVLVPPFTALTTKRKRRIGIMEELIKKIAARIEAGDKVKNISSRLFVSKQTVYKVWSSEQTIGGVFRPLLWRNRHDMSTALIFELKSFKLMRPVNQATCCDSFVLAIWPRLSKFEHDRVLSGVFKTALSNDTFGMGTLWNRDWIFKGVIALCLGTFWLAATQNLLQGPWARNSVNDDLPPVLDFKNVSKLGQKVWISMAVCFSSTTQMTDRHERPYKYSLTLSTDLWTKLTDHFVFIHVVFEPQDAQSPELLDYVGRLNRSSRVHVALSQSAHLQCPLQAQIVRMIPPKLDFIRGDDMWVTSDTDAFPMVPSILHPLSLPYKVWIFQFEYSLQEAFSFPMCFIAMAVHRWRDTLVHDNPVNLVEDYAKTYKLDAKRTWGYDQSIITIALLSTKQCRFPANHPIYPALGLQAPEIGAWDDRDTCFHGTKWANCNKGSPTQPYPCSWWHFYPKETKKDMWMTYHKILRTHNLGSQAL
eukprot:maker-scaffold1070_size64748-snap-gene-0.15 protein:Tk03038 transcript:maker-scaffold1070_size64748-snap-gene-0.15-mRNA-1 annotation:"hypothetical protein DAPPUDRAFT_120119"